MTPQPINGYGWRPQMPDPRDQIFGLEEKVLAPHQLPRKFSLRDAFKGYGLEVFDQLRIGTCVPNHAVENILFRAASTGKSYPMLSRLFVYARGREREGTPLTVDSGMQVRDAFKVLGFDGAPPESDMPYSDQEPVWQEEPSAKAVADALRFEAVVYKSVTVRAPGAPMRSAIYAGMPISYGFPVPALFEDPSWDPATTPVPLPDANTPMTGEGHCENVIGWDFTLERFPVPVWEIRNSWSKDWGDEGHHWMEYRWFDPERGLASDLWVVVSVE